MLGRLSLHGVIVFSISLFMHSILKRSLFVSLNIGSDCPEKP